MRKRWEAGASIEASHASEPTLGPSLASTIAAIGAEPGYAAAEIEFHRLPAESLIN